MSSSSTPRKEDAEKALVQLEQVYELYRQEYGPDAQNVDLAKMLTHLGTLHMDLGHPEEARVKLEQAVGMYRRVCGNAPNDGLVKALKKLDVLKETSGTHENKDERAPSSSTTYRFSV